MKNGTVCGAVLAVVSSSAMAQDNINPADAELESIPVETSTSAGSYTRGSGLRLYAGLEYDMTTVDFDEGKQREDFGGRRFDSDFYKLRLGARLFDGVAVELHAGLPANRAGGDEVETQQFYALYLVPTGVLLNVVEISARLGYAFTTVENKNASADLDGASFGVAVELPFRIFGEGPPNFRVGAGATVYQADRDARVFGVHGGLRFDFTV